MFPLQISQCMIHILILLGRPNPHISPNFTYFYTCLYNPSYSKSYTHSNFTLSPSLTNGGIFKSNNRMESANSEKENWDHFFLSHKTFLGGNGQKLFSIHRKIWINAISFSSISLYCRDLVYIYQILKQCYFYKSGNSPCNKTLQLWTSH